MLLGVPGSGKTTFVNHLASSLAAAKRTHLQGQLLATTEVHLAQTLPGWSPGVLLPIRIILRDFAAFASSASNGKSRLLLDFLHRTLDEQGCTDALPLVQRHIQHGEALLLLDGLDEVVGEVLARVAESIAAVVHTCPSPILVTCRILDYQAEPLRQLAGFLTYTLAPFTDEQVEQFVAGWYGELQASGRRSLSQARADIASLKQAIAARAELRDLARLPLLLTVMAIVHASKGNLPDARALLYAECIEVLMLKWRQRSDEDDLLTRLKLPQFRSSDLMALMAHLGYTAHEHAWRTVDKATDAPADLHERDVIGLLAERFERYDAERRYELAQMVVDALDQGNGLLLKRGPQVYAFPHRTFQEFLAGYHLMGQPNAVRLCLERSHHPHWYEPLLLMVGYLVLTSREFDKPLTLVEKLLEHSPAEQVLAGELLLQIGRERLASYDKSQVSKDGTWQHTRRTLLCLVRQGRVPEVPAMLRVRAGLTIGHLCTYDASDAQLPVYDPRLPMAIIGLPGQFHPSWQEMMKHYWCRVEAGDFWFGDESKERLKKINLPYSFLIARYSLTNADYARFIEADGYEDKQWWTWLGWKERTKQNWSEPRYWHELKYNNPMQPDVFLVCLSARSVTKRGYLNREIVTALDIADEQPEGAIFIIPVRLEPCSVPDRLSRWQWVNLYEDGGYERLRAALRARAEQGRNG